MTSRFSFDQVGDELLRCPRIPLSEVRVSKANSWQLKADFLEVLPPCSRALSKRAWLRERLVTLLMPERVSIYSLLAIGQTHLFDVPPSKIADGEKKWRAFLDSLLDTERLYADIGGVLGYHLKVLQLLRGPIDSGSLHCSPAPVFDWSRRGPLIETAVRAALEKWHQTAMILPAGGAGDRLNLTDPRTRQPLPAAFLQLDGKSLLESLLRDLRGCEYLVYKATGRRVETPILIMTSSEKGNHDRIAQYLRDHRWFGRSKESFRLFSQPSVPVLTSSGRWANSAPFELVTKPGGHGVIWRLARWSGAFDWLRARHCQKAVVRQINNPLAGSDIGLLALAGLGWHLGKPLGFASCPQKSGTAEGVNALLERREFARDAFSYAIENIEYTELTCDLKASTSSQQPYSANVNLLFVDLPTLEQLSLEHPLPGLTINFKGKFGFSAKGEWIEEAAGRLESTMQNISRYMRRTQKSRLVDVAPDHFPQFATFGERLKSLSAAKRAPMAPAEAETPGAAYWDLQLNHYHLLRSCGFELPFLSALVAHRGHPPAIVALHPALGPDHAVIRQKLINGYLHRGAELRLEIAEIDCRNLRVRGSCVVECTASGDRVSTLTPFPELSGRCTLWSVEVDNAGSKPPPAEFWSEPPPRQEALHIVLHGCSEFFAEGVAFRGNRRIEVPAGHKMTAVDCDGRIHFELREIDEPTWHWSHRWNARGLHLTRQRASSEQVRVASEDRNSQSGEVLAALSAAREKTAS